MTTTAYFPASEQSIGTPRTRGGLRGFLAAVFAGPARRSEDQIADYLQHHQHDLPAAVRIELERRWMGP